MCIYIYIYIYGAIIEMGREEENECKQGAILQSPRSLGFTSFGFTSFGFTSFWFGDLIFE